MEFFEVLGITNASNVAYLSTLWRILYEAAIKLDAHLAPHAASLHSAVSRNYSSGSPNEPPRYRWIRVVDGLGFFSDKDNNAERIFNIGLSFPYRHLGLIAIGEDNAVLLRHRPSAAPALAEVGGPASVNRSAGTPVPDGAAEDEVPAGGAGTTVPVGGVVVRERPSASEREGSEERALPATPVPETEKTPSSVAMKSHVQEPQASSGGRLVAETSDSRPPARGNAELKDGRTRPRPRDLPPGASQRRAGGVDPSAHRATTGGVPIEAGGLVVIDRSQPAVARDPVSGGEGDAFPSETDPSGSQPKEYFEKQPVIMPPSLAVDTVTAALEPLIEMEDATSVLRSFLNDSLLCTARMRRTRAQEDASSHEEVVWSHMVDMLASLWPMWSAPARMVAGPPPPGTVNFIANPRRPWRSSRWMVKVTMAGINATLDKFAAKRYRYLPKHALADYEEVGPYSASFKLRLPAVAAMTMLVCTKDEQFGSVMARIVE